EGQFHEPYLLVIVVLLALLMVSNIKYYSGKDMKLFTRMPFMSFLIVVGLLLLIVHSPEVMVFVIMVAYAIHGPIWWLIKFIRETREKKSVQDK
ncbi:MAG TPA: CDP-diacylglycerol--serine O-phosphatidyltransferase, partial [Smithellaceae bacterium]|nr:CDP-diacylglycerol--serine O-phosphatidyltransferase [Smithellaceae bacterium]